MFGLMKESTHEAAMAKLTERLKKEQERFNSQFLLANGLTADVQSLRETNYALDRTAAAYKRERDALQAKVDRMTANLKKGNKPGAGTIPATNLQADNAAPAGVHQVAN